uniref:Uncharacterized protein n=1 Tax=Arundo donax TaxID=35708 RepID=A0A0A8ZN22_ARUDO
MKTELHPRREENRPGLVSPSGTLPGLFHIFIYGYWSSPSTNAVLQTCILLFFSSIQEIISGCWMFLALPADFTITEKSTQIN